MRVHFQEAPFGYDKIQQNCHWFCSTVLFKKCTLQLRNLLSSFPCPNVFCVTPSEFQHNSRDGELDPKRALEFTRISDVSDSITVAFNQLSPCIWHYWVHLKKKNWKICAIYYHQFQVIFPRWNTKIRSGFWSASRTTGARTLTLGRERPSFWWKTVLPHMYAGFYSFCNLSNSFWGIDVQLRTR